MSIAAYELLLWFLGLAGLILAGGKLMGLVANTVHLRWAYAVAGVFGLAVLAHITSFLAAYVFPDALATIAEVAREFSAATVINGLVVWIWVELARGARSLKPQVLQFFARLACVAVVCYGIGNWLLSVGTLAVLQLT